VCPSPLARRAPSLRACAPPPPCAAADEGAAAALAPARVAFRVAHKAAFGQAVRVVGEPAALGGWDPEQAAVLEWTEGDVWVGAAALPPGAHAFKLVVAGADGGGALWEEGPNRVVEVAAGSGAAPAAVACAFGAPAADAAAATGKLKMEGRVGKLKMEGDAAAAAAANGSVGKMTAEGAAPALGKMEAEAGAATAPAAVAAAEAQPRAPPGFGAAGGDALDAGAGRRLLLGALPLAGAAVVVAALAARALGGGPDVAGIFPGPRK
jgi:hypothetical protein